MPFPVAAAIVAGSSLLGTGINAASQGSMNKKTRKWNEKQYQLQRENALSDWHMQNDYNSPAAQMQRFKDAGLNPHLIYGQGNPGNAESVVGTDIKSWQPDAPFKTDLGRDAQSAISAQYDAELKGAQTDNLTALNDKIQAEKELIIAQKAQTEATTLSTLTNTERSKYDLEYQKSIRDKLVQQLEANIAQANASAKVSLDANDRAAMMQDPLLRKIESEIKAIAAGQGLTVAQVNKLASELSGVNLDNKLKELKLSYWRKGVNPDQSGLLGLLTRLSANSSNSTLLDGVPANKAGFGLPDFKTKFGGKIKR